MRDLDGFRAAVREYRRGAGRAQQHLARAVGLHPNVLSHKLNAHPGAVLTTPEVIGIVTTLAGWGALATRADAEALLGSMDVPPHALPAGFWTTLPMVALAGEAAGPARVPPLQVAVAGMVPAPAPAGTGPQRLAVAPLPAPRTPVIGRELERAEVAAGLAASRLMTLTGAAAAWPAAAGEATSADCGLPAPRTLLHGREPEVARVTAAVESGARLVTVTGAGGVGKTRVAIEAARRLAGQFAVGPVFVPLAGVTWAGDLAPAVAGALALAGAPGLSPVQALHGALRHQEAVLVLDNFEQILGALGDVTSLLDACPGVRLIVTSRAVLRCDGEVVVELGPLPVPPPCSAAPGQDELDAVARVPSVAVFVERARSAAAGFRLDAGTAQAVAEICRTVSGVPLALELAAARLNVLPPGELSARLHGGQLAVLARGARDLPARQQSLRATIEWSLGLLPGRERALLARVSVFEHGFSLPAAESVCADPAGTRRPVVSQGDILDLVAALVDAHLLEPDDRPASPARFVLPVPVRELARQQLAGPAEARLQARLDSYFLQWGVTAGAGLESRDEQLWLDRAGRDIDQVRVVLSRISRDEPLRAVQLAARLGPFWLYRGLLAEGRAHLAPAAALTGRDDRERSVLAGALAWDARLALDQGVADDDQGSAVIVARLRHALELARTAGAVTDVLRVTEFLSHALAANRAASLAGQALTLEAAGMARATSQEWWLAQLLQRAAVLARRLGNLDVAAGYAREALALSRALGASRLVLHAGLSIAQLPQAAEDAPPLEELLELARTVNSPRTTVAVLHVIGTQALLNADPPAAAAAYRDAVLTSRNIGYWQGVGHTAMACAVLASAQGNPAICARLHGAASARLSLQRTVPPEYHDLYTQAIDRQRAAAGPATFENHAAEGSAWSWDELASQTLKFTDGLAPQDHPLSPRPAYRPARGHPDPA